ncbi:hypothetical protein K474DRAFT_1705515 [Panus rudis PR-1116 ss-1]|nr:hypothetical protein K474DRAFT_1705515 [Panus rudis PR-1116 ss-1]
MNPNSSTLGKEDCDDEPEIQFTKRRVRPTTRRILANGSNLNVINLDDSDEDIHHSASQFNTIIDLVEEDVSIEMVLAEDSKLLCPCHNAETVDDISSLLHPASYRRAKTSNILHGIAQVASRSNNMQQTVHSKIVKSYHICKLMPGAVNMIAQSGYYCGIAGATSTEENCEDANQSYINPHSVSSTVGMYSNKQDRLYIPSKGHVEKKTKENTVLYMHSAVTSISFDPIQ